MNEHGTYWLTTAHYDMDTAKAMQRARRYLYVGFLCHLTIEKALKGSIASVDEDSFPAKIHNLIRLAENCPLREELSEDQWDLLAALNPLNIEARYPSIRESISSSLDRDKCKALIAETEELLCWIENRLLGLPNDMPAQ